MILIALLVLVVAASLRGLLGTLHDDGLGRRPGPRSHTLDAFENPRA